MISRTFQSLKRALRIGKERFFVGHDLAGNSYYEKPPVANDRGRLRPRRFVNFKLQMSHPSLYRNQLLPPQWLAWLSFTRSHPPSLEELHVDQARQQQLQENIRRHELLDRENKSVKHALDQSLLNQSSADSSPGPLLDGTPTAESGLEAQEIERKRREMNKSPLSAFRIQQSNPDQHWKPEEWNPHSSSRNR